MHVCTALTALAILLSGPGGRGVEKTLKVSFPNRRTPANAAHLTPPSGLLKVRLRAPLDLGPCKVTVLTFPSPVKTPFPCNNTVWCELFEPAANKAGPACVVLHFLNDPSFVVTRLVCQKLAAKGIRALLLKLPYYGERKPPSLKEGKIQPDLKQLVAAWRQGIQDTRCALAFLASCKEVDPRRLGLVGISLGALIGATVTAVDPRVKRSVLILGGGDLVSVLWSAPEAEELRSRLKAGGVTREEAARILAPVEPLRFAAPLPSGTVLMINALQDRTVPPQCARALARAFGGAKVLWYPTSHTGLSAHFNEVLAETIDFLQSGR